MYEHTLIHKSVDVKRLQVLRYLSTLDKIAHFLTAQKIQNEKQIISGTIVHLRKQGDTLSQKRLYVTKGIAGESNRMRLKEALEFFLACQMT